MIETRTVYFEKPGKDNTEEVFRICKQRASELGIKSILVASTYGDAAVRASELFKGLKVIAVTHAMGWRDQNVQQFTDENREKVESLGGIVYTGTHTFGGLDRAVRRKFNTYLLSDIVANVLYIFGQGMKVVVEIATMAVDAGLIRNDEDVIVIAGTGRGADTAVVLKPANSRDFFDLRVKEILCKPRLDAIPQSQTAAVPAESQHHHH